MIYYKSTESRLNNSLSVRKENAKFRLVCESKNLIKLNYNNQY